MSETPFFSIIIPTYNRADKLDIPIKSILNQQFKNWELIIIDDESTDETNALIQNYSSHNIHYFYQQHQGRSTARNLGISKARGTYICFQDSDDEYLPDHLQTLYEAILKNDSYRVFRTGMLIYENGKGEISPTEGPTRIPMLKKVEDALVTGPLLLKNSQINNLQKRPFNDLKHPRSAICLGKKEIWLVAVDGRHKEATGLNLNELSQFLLSCGCQHAINLDGGGSTTLFLNTNKFNGIVNHPSDNKKFDPEGERPVANILFIRKNN